MSLILSGTDGLSDVDGSAATPAIRGTDANTGIFFPAADTIAFAEGGAEVARFDSSGNFGLGVTPSAWATYKAIDVLGYASFSSYNGNEADMSTNAYYNAGWKYKNTAAATLYQQDAGVHRWQYAASGTAGNAITWTQAMTLNASGNLGVGTTSPAQRLHVVGGQVQFNNGSDLYINSGASDVGFYSTGNIPMIFYTNSTERARIDSSGNLLVGTTSAVARIGAYGSNADIQRIYSTQASSSSYTFISMFSDGATPSAPTGTLRVNIVTNGGIQNYSANNVNLSDRREKTNFAPAKSYLDVICAIPVQTFNYIDQNMEDDPGLTLGVVAQDVQAVAPELVSEGNWASKDEEPKMRLSIYQTDLQYALMKCIQEQQTLITQLTARITALESA